MIERWLPLLIGMALDLFDYFVVGFIPIIGDIIDIFGMVIFYKYIGIVALAGAVELIPLADILPTFSALGLYASLKRKHQ